MRARAARLVAERTIWLSNRHAPQMDALSIFAAGTLERHLADAIDGWEAGNRELDPGEVVFRLLNVAAFVMVHSAKPENMNRTVDASAKYLAQFTDYLIGCEPLRAEELTRRAAVEKAASETEGEAGAEIISFSERRKS